jgi:two-component system OmpR family sensor kinase
MFADMLPALDEVDLASVIGVVDRAFDLEDRLTATRRSPALEAAGPCRVFGDERLLTAAIGVVVTAVRAMAGGRGESGRIAVSIGPRRDALTRTLEVSQAAVRMPTSAYARFFDAGWSGHPAGPTGALCLAAAQRIALAHGGALEVVAADGGGCRLVLTLPAAE